MVKLCDQIPVANFRIANWGLGWEFQPRGQGVNEKWNALHCESHFQK